MSVRLGPIAGERVAAGAEVACRSAPRSCKVACLALANCERGYPERVKHGYKDSGSRWDVWPRRRQLRRAAVPPAGRAPPARRARAAPRAPAERAGGAGAVLLRPVRG